MKLTSLILALLVVVAGGAEDPSLRLGLSSHEGKVVYVDFWASWCVPCKGSFKWMNAMHGKYSEQGLVIIAVNVDSDQNAAARFLEEHPADFRLLYDPKAELATHYDLPAMPTSYVYGPDGKLHSTHVGFQEENAADLEQTIVSLLKEVKAE